MSDIQTMDLSSLPTIALKLNPDGTLSVPDNLPDDSLDINERVNEMNRQIRQSRLDRFARMFSQTGQLAFAFISIYGTQGSIEHTFPDYSSLKYAIVNTNQRLSDDLMDKLQVQYNNMMSK